MAVDTKPNLNSGKFEQLSGETLNLSGCTNIYGRFAIGSGATLSILPNRGTGKVLTSNSGGTATWQTPVAGGIGWSNEARGTTVAGCGTPASGNTICENTFYGVYAGLSITSGQGNVAVGKSALQQNSTGNYNVAVGLGALLNSNGSSNVAINSFALNANTIGVGNTAIGNEAMSNNTCGNHNTAIGCQALPNNISGNSNVAIGAQALYINSCGDNNIAIGCAALFSNTCGCGNIGLGFHTLEFNTTGYYNIGLGYRALRLNSTGGDNIALGQYSLYCNLTGDENIAIGYGTLQQNCGGSWNIANGFGALQYNRSGNFNIALGYTALPANIGGSGNIALGATSIFKNTSGISNTGIGSGALKNNRTGDYNVAIGSDSLYSASGSSNVAIGYCAGYFETGSSRLYIANSDARTLIYGEFDNEKLCIRGKTYISGLTNSTNSNVIYYNTGTKELTYGTAPSGGASTSSQNVTKTIVQESHGFTVGNVIGWSGGTYNKAIANGLYDGEVIGVVDYVSGNTFKVTQSGYITGLTGLVTSDTYFLSDITAGLLSSIEPTGDTHISKSMFVATSSSTGWVLPYAGYVVSTGGTGGGTVTGGLNIGSGVGIYSSLVTGNLEFKSLRGSGNTYVVQSGNTIIIRSSGGTGGGTITGGTNGLGVSGANITLGGILTGTTTICSNGNKFEVCCNGVGLAVCDASSQVMLGNIAGGNSTWFAVDKISQQISSRIICPSGGGYVVNNMTDTDITMKAYDNNVNLSCSCLMLCNNGIACVVGSKNILLTAPSGATYGANYSSGFTSRSLVDKGYVDSYIVSKITGTTMTIYVITGDSTTTGFSVNHGLGNRFVGIEIVKNTSPYHTVYTDVSRPSANAVCVTFDTAPASGQQYKVLIFNTGNTGAGGGGSFASLNAEIGVVSTNTYTLQASDAGKIIEFTNTGNTTITLPSGLPLGFQAVLTNVGGADKTLTAGGGTTLYTLASKVKIAGAYNAGTVYYRAVNKWVGFGNLS